MPPRNRFKAPSNAVGPPLTTTSPTPAHRLQRTGSSGTGSRKPARQPDTAAEHRLVARLTDALERADLDALIELLVTDVRVSMPPAMLEYRGIESAQRFFAAATFRPGRTYRVVPTRANGQPAFGLYLADPHASVYRAYALLVITTAGDHITAITGFTAEVMTRFGLPRTLPEVCLAKGVSGGWVSRSRRPGSGRRR